MACLLARAWGIAFVLGAALFVVGASARAQSAPPSQPGPADAFDSLRVQRPYPDDAPRYPIDTLTTRTIDGRLVAAGGRPHRPATGAGRDTTRVMPWHVQLWGEGGGGGMVAPGDVRQFFQAGVGASVLMRREWSSWTGASLRMDYQSIPRANQVQVLTTNGFEMVSLGGNGTLFATTVGPSVRLWHRLWAETGVGLAHLRVASGDDILGSLADPAAITATRNTTGLALDARLAWRFPISDTQSMSVTLGWQGHRAGDSGRWLGYVPVRIGWRFL